MAGLRATRRPGAGVHLTALLVLATLGGGCARPASEQDPPPAPTPTAAPTAGPAPDLVVLTDVDPRIRADIRYATAHNFVGRPVAGYAEPLCLLTRPAAAALRRAQDAALARDRGLKVYDCYRPRRAVEDFVAWGRRPGEEQTKGEFYPRVPKSELFDRGYLGAPTAHSRGSTVDLTLVDVPTPEQPAYDPARPLVPCTAPRARRFPDNSVDMGTGFDCFDPLAHTDSPAVDATARANRDLLREVMTGAGFVNYDREWWHYRYRDEPYPDTYFDVPVARASAR
ncbi:M15 family metallopeptidase [Micromonospora endolithica]|uniref:D-alanyl-D-alanine dipeptidase n=1 Tax=Micromonospora endolithica TaxID=230091 RepID=A0A3A9ZT27_9ACTN|nr:M15 family metallopeptidase [Micromonospora endolithica]RKN51114.1 D-alanyl-D-alanine dipeptidase [Micromonospora endolithica]TWJ22311.1 D-Ala-D-Ala dipeptidase vanX Metallo peptidase MEROPS family M15D [Micromonospora endolithica]